MESHDQLNETVTLDLEESNDLTFKIKMEGTAMSPAKVRLVCENDDFAYMFNGYGTGEDEVVQFTMPRMDKKITEGTYNARVEVLVDNRYFAPLQFQINFKKTLSVFAESIQVVRKPSSDVTVTASSLSVSRPSVPAATAIKFEQRPQAAPPAQTVAKQKPHVEQRAAALPVQADSADLSSKFSLREAYLNKIGIAKDIQTQSQSLRDKFKK